MKFFVGFLLLTIGVACSTGQFMTSWGDVINAKLLGEQKVEVAGGLFQIKERTVAYRSNEPALIRGVMHLDYNKNARASPSISEGGVGHPNVVVRIVSQRGHGINSLVRFFG